MDDSKNINFFLEDKNEDKNNEGEIQKMLDNFCCDDYLRDDQYYLQGENYVSKNKYNIPSDIEYGLYFSQPNTSEIYQEYTVKDLLKICNYYGIDKDIKSSKCKKQDIIETIVYFENLPENSSIVSKRMKMWTYMTELLLDPKMRQYILF